MVKQFYLLTIILLIVTGISAQNLSIIPKPLEMKPGSGQFIIDNNCSLQFETSNTEVARIGVFFSDYLKQLYNISLNNNKTEKTIQIKIDNNANLPKEGYLLKQLKNRW